MARKLIGTGVTDANGEATITYTGTGAGKLNIVAESGTFVSEPYPVIDALMLDRGKSSDYTYLISPTNALQRKTDYTTFYYDNTSGTGQYQCNFPSQVSLSTQMRVEIDILRQTYCKMQYARYETNKTNHYDSFILDENQTGTVRIDLLTTGTNVYLNGERIKQNNNTNNEKFSLFFQVPSGKIGDFDYKDLRVYPI